MVKRSLRGFWPFLLFVALLAAWPPPSPGLTLHGVPALTSSSPELAAVIHQAGAYDIATAARIVRHWKSRNPGHAGDAALAPAPFGLAIPHRGSAVRGGEFTEMARQQPLRHFDSRAPPSAC